MIQSLKLRFSIMFILLLVILVGIQWHDEKLERQHNYAQEMIDKLSSIHKSFLKIRCTEQDFYLEFNEAYLYNFSHLVQLFYSKLDGLKDYPELLLFYDRIVNDMHDYVKVFNAITARNYDIGYSKKQGLQKHFYEVVNRLESSFSSHNKFSLRVLILQMRQAEKDFLLGDEKSAVQTYLSLFDKLKHYKLTNKQSTMFYSYRKAFMKLAEKIQEIGLHDGDALRAELRNHAVKIESSIVERFKNMKQDLTKNVLPENGNLLYCSLVFILFFLAVLLWIVRPIIKGLNKFRYFFKESSLMPKELSLEDFTLKEMQSIALSINKRLQTQAEMLRSSSILRSKQEHILNHRNASQIQSLQTSLTLIMNLTQGDYKKSTQVEALIGNTLEMASLLNKSLDFSKMQNKELELHVESFDITDLINHLVQCLQKVCNQKNIILHTAFNMGDIENVLGDALRISEILIHIIDNAVKYTPNHGAISIEFSYKSEALYVMVVDSGEGMSKTTVEKILSYNQDNDQALDGLGLVMSQGLAELMDAHIEFKSHLGEGSLVTITLPLVSTTREPKTLPKFYINTTNKHPHILVVVDNPNKEDFLACMLKDFGYKYNVPDIT